MLMIILALLHLLLYTLVSSQNNSFTFNGFRSTNLLILDGIAELTPNGLLKLANYSQSQQGHAFYSNNITFKRNGTTSPKISLFSTTFVFAIVPQYPKVSANGLAFVIAPTRGLANALPREYLGLFNRRNNGNATNHIFAVELDTAQDNEAGDSDDNHVGIDINGIKSKVSQPAGYYRDNSGAFVSLALSSGMPMQVWVEYDALENKTDVTLAPIDVGKPKRPLLSLSYDLSSVINQEMFVGFTSSSAAKLNSTHYVLGWSFMVNGTATPLILNQLPKLPRFGPKKGRTLLIIRLPLVFVIVTSISLAAMIYYIRRRMKFAEVLEDWELEYGPHRFKYKDLYVATKGFKDNELLGSGGFGKVYKGVLPYSKVEVAIKRVSHESRQGMREFIAEIVSIGRVRHRNIVPLLGYCRRKDELLLVYEYMPNGSLDKVIHNHSNSSTLCWSQRFRVIKGIAAGLSYLHQEWEKVVIHRDVKASNILLDGELNGRLGDFGLARLYDHGTNPQTTHIVGTFGYLAPEHARTGKSTTKTDVYSFGAFLLEVACGKRPIEETESQEIIILVDYVFSCWSKDEVLQAIDHRLGSDYVTEEVELVLKLGLLCCNSQPLGRPTMQQVVQYLEGNARLPELSSANISSVGISFSQGFDEYLEISCSSSRDTTFTRENSTTESLLSCGR